MYNYGSISIKVIVVWICDNKVLQHSVQITPEMLKYAVLHEKNITFNWISRERRRQRKKADN